MTKTDLGFSDGFSASLKTRVRSVPPFGAFALSANRRMTSSDVFTLSYLLNAAKKYERGIDVKVER